MPRRKLTSEGLVAVPYIETRDSTDSCWYAKTTELGFTTGVASSITVDAFMTVFNSDERFLNVSTTINAVMGVPLIIASGTFLPMAQRMANASGTTARHIVPRLYYLGTTLSPTTFQQDVPTRISWTRPIKSSNLPMTVTVDGVEYSEAVTGDFKLEKRYSSIGAQYVPYETSSSSTNPSRASHVRLYRLGTTQDGTTVCVLKPMRRTVDGTERVGLYNEITGIFHEAKNMDYGIEMMLPSVAMGGGRGSYSLLGDIGNLMEAA